HIDGCRIEVGTMTLEQLHDCCCVWDTPGPIREQMQRRSSGSCFPHNANGKHMGNSSAGGGSQPRPAGKNVRARPARRPPAAPPGPAWRADARGSAYKEIRQRKCSAPHQVAETILLLCVFALRSWPMSSPPRGFKRPGPIVSFLLEQGFTLWQFLVLPVL